MTSLIVSHNAANKALNLTKHSLDDLFLKQSNNHEKKKLLLNTSDSNPMIKFVLGRRQHISVKNLLSHIDQPISC